MIEMGAGAARLDEYRIGAGPLHWLVSLTRDAGWMRLHHTPNGTIAGGLGWPDIVAWVEGGGMHHVEPRWRREIMRLSVAYAGEFNAAHATLECPVPFQPECSS